MDWPRCIREFVGVFIAINEQIKRDREWKKFQKPMFDWLVDKLVYKVIEGWYKTTKQTDPMLLTKEGVRKHVRWWPAWRKNAEFFERNDAVPIRNVADDICLAFREQFPESNMFASVFFSSQPQTIRTAVKAKIRKEIF